MMAVKSDNKNMTKVGLIDGLHKVRKRTGSFSTHSTTMKRD